MILKTPIGHYKATFNTQGKLLRLDHTETKATTPTATHETTLTLQLQNYFKNPKEPFSITYQLEGTPFQKKLWQLLSTIPTGETRTYGQLAKQLNSSAQAVGNACRNNPISIIIPCHRVTAKDHLGGYSGHTTGAPMERKRWLLSHEGIALI